jgi:hypothetical protein
VKIVANEASFHASNVGLAKNINKYNVLSFEKKKRMLGQLIY